MNKRIKWGIIILIGAGLAGLGIYQFTPHENEELTAADALPKENKQRTLKVNAQVIKPHLLTDEILVTGRLVPDEEVSLSFETSGKITDIFFTEGTLVKRGELLAKVNDRQLQAQLKRLEAQIPLAEDRVFRQNALLKRDAVSKEAYEQVKTEIIVSVDTVLLLPILFNSSANTTAKITMEIFVSGIPHTTPTAIPVSAECPRASEKYAIFLLTIMVPISPNSGVMISIAANAIFIKP